MTVIIPTRAKIRLSLDPVRSLCLGQGFFDSYERRVEYHLVPHQPYRNFMDAGPLRIDCDQHGRPVLIDLRLPDSENAGMIRQRPSLDILPAMPRFLDLPCQLPESNIRVEFSLSPKIAIPLSGVVKPPGGKSNLVIVHDSWKDRLDPQSHLRNPVRSLASSVPDDAVTFTGGAYLSRRPRAAKRRTVFSGTFPRQSVVSNSEVSCCHVSFSDAEVTKGCAFSSGLIWELDRRDNLCGLWILDLISDPFEGVRRVWRTQAWRNTRLHQNPCPQASRREGLSPISAGFTL